MPSVLLTSTVTSNYGLGAGITAGPTSAWLTMGPGCQTTTGITCSNPISRLKKAVLDSVSSCLTESLGSTKANSYTRGTGEAAYSRPLCRHSAADRGHQVLQLDGLDQVVTRFKSLGQGPRARIVGSCNHDGTSRGQHRTRPRIEP